MKIDEREAEIEAICLAWQMLHRTLKPLRELGVSIPYAKQIIPSGRDVSMRRNFKLLLNYIRASASFNQHVRRKRSDDGRVIAEAFDYRFAHRLLVAAAPRMHKLVGDRARKVFDEKLKPKLEGGSTLTSPQILKLLGKGKSGYAWINDYVVAGMLQEDTANKKGNTKQYLLGSDTSDTPDELGLVDPAEIELAFPDTSPPSTLDSKLNNGMSPEKPMDSASPCQILKIESNLNSESKSKSTDNSVIQIGVKKSNMNLESPSTERYESYSNIPAETARDGVHGGGYEYLFLE